MPPVRFTLAGTAIAFDPDTGTGAVGLDDGVVLPFDAAALAAGPFRLLRIGQRVRVDMVAGVVTLVTLPTLHR